MRVTTVLAACLAVGWAAGCGGGAEPPVSESTAASAAASTPAASTAAAPAADAPKTPSDLFPDGPHKEAVINNCASCHNLACSVIGQRTAERWDSLQKSHADYTPGADLGAIFGYLKTNFDSTKPEPIVPPAFLEGGCTPF